MISHRTKHGSWTYSLMVPFVSARLILSFCWQGKRYMDVIRKKNLPLYWHPMCSYLACDDFWYINNLTNFCGLTITRLVFGWVIEPDAVSVFQILEQFAQMRLTDVFYASAHLSVYYYHSLISSTAHTEQLINKKII